MILTRTEARGALDALSSGTPPSEKIMEFITIGLEDDLKIFEDEYFSAENGTLPNTDQGTFKIIEAYYGGGKTHYLKSIEKLAHKNGFASAFLELNKDSCPLTQWELIYSNVITKLTLPATEKTPKAVGIEEVLRTLLLPPTDKEDIDPSTYADDRMREIRDLPFPSLRAALHKAAEATASNDRSALDDCLLYLRTGKVSPNMRRRVALEPIDKKTGALAIQSLVVWLRQMGIPGLVLIMDEGDRSLSLPKKGDTKIASNNLVQIINETSKAWAGVMFLYSIPSWSAFKESFQDNQALIQRVDSVGFPTSPNAKRIVLDEKYVNEKEKLSLCKAISEKIAIIFNSARDYEITDSKRDEYAVLTANAVFKLTDEVHFRRLFYQSFIAVLDTLKSGKEPSRSDIENIVSSRPQS